MQNNNQTVTTNNYYSNPPKQYINSNVPISNFNLNKNQINQTTEAVKILEMKNDIKNYRSNSHTFQLSHSRNPSAIDNMNSSFNRDLGKIKENLGNSNNSSLFNNKNNINVINNSNSNSNNIDLSNYNNNHRKHSNINNDYNSNLIGNSFSNNNSNKPSNSPLPRNNCDNLHERDLNLIKPYTKIDREVTQTNASNKDTNEVENDEKMKMNKGNKEYLYPYRQDYGKKSINNLAQKSPNFGTGLREEIKITNIQANMNQIGKLTGFINTNNNAEKDQNDRTNFPFKQKSQINDECANNDDENTNVNKHIFNRISNNDNNKYINLEFVNLTRKKSILNIILIL